MGNGVLVVCAVLGAGVFGFVAGLVTARPSKHGSGTFPFTHVSFDRTATDDMRLRLLDEARTAVIDGRLSQANQLQDYRTTDQSAKPGPSLEN